MEILTHRAGRVFTVEFNRPAKKNAITAAMYQALADALQQAEQDVEVRAILLSGKAEVFTAGNDLLDFLQHPPQTADSPVYRFMQQLSNAGKPVVAAVAGPAVGIGTTMLLHCDLVYAADNAKFMLPFAQLGLCPEFGSSLLLQQIAGYQRAAEKLLLGESFGAEEACEMGLVNRVLPFDQLLPFARAQAEKLAALPPASVRATRHLMRMSRKTALEAQMAEEIDCFRQMLTAPEAKEAFAAFLEKRKPDFNRFS